MSRHQESLGEACFIYTLIVLSELFYFHYRYKVFGADVVVLIQECIYLATFLVIRHVFESMSIK